MGGSIVIHTFGAYFGLAFSYMVGVPRPGEDAREESTYYSDVFSMVGKLHISKISILSVLFIFDLKLMNM